MPDGEKNLSFKFYRVAYSGQSTGTLVSTLSGSKNVKFQDQEAIYLITGAWGSCDATLDMTTALYTDLTTSADDKFDLSTIEIEVPFEGYASKAEATVTLCATSSSCSCESFTVENKNNKNTFTVPIANYFSASIEYEDGTVSDVALPLVSPLSVALPDTGSLEFPPLLNVGGQITICGEKHADLSTSVNVPVTPECTPVLQLWIPANDPVITVEKDLTYTVAVDGTFAYTESDLPVIPMSMEMSPLLDMSVYITSGEEYVYTVTIGDGYDCSCSWGGDDDDDESPVGPYYLLEGSYAVGASITTKGGSYSKAPIPFQCTTADGCLEDPSHLLFANLQIDRVPEDSRVEVLPFDIEIDPTVASKMGYFVTDDSFDTLASWTTALVQSTYYLSFYGPGSQSESVVQTHEVRDWNVDLSEVSFGTITSSFNGKTTTQVQLKLVTASGSAVPIHSNANHITQVWSNDIRLYVPIGGEYMIKVKYTDETEEEFGPLSPVLPGEVTRIEMTQYSDFGDTRVGTIDNMGMSASQADQIPSALPVDTEIAESGPAVSAAAMSGTWGAECLLFHNAIGSWVGFTPITLDYCAPGVVTEVNGLFTVEAGRRILVTKDLTSALPTAPTLDATNTVAFRNVRYGVLSGATPAADVATPSVPATLPAGYAVTLGDAHGLFALLGAPRRFGSSVLCYAGPNGAVDSFGVDAISGQAVDGSTPCYIESAGYIAPLVANAAVVVSKADVTADDWSPDAPTKITNNVDRLGSSYCTIDNVAASSTSAPASNPTRMPTGWVLADTTDTNLLYVAKRSKWAASCVVGEDTGTDYAIRVGCATRCSFVASTVTATDPLDSSTVYFPSALNTRVIITADAPTYAVCASTGDPHLRTFDGSRWDIHGYGDYVMTNLQPSTDPLREWGLDVQFRLRKWNNVGVTHGVAVHLWSTKQGESFDCTVELLANDNDISPDSQDPPADINELSPVLKINGGSATCSALDVSIISDTASKYELQILSTGAFEQAHSLASDLIKVRLKSFISSKRGALFNTYITLSSDAMTAGGVCGTYTGTKADDLQLPDGTSTSLVRRHATALRDYYRCCSQALYDSEVVNYVSIFGTPTCDIDDPTTPPDLPDPNDPNYDASYAVCVQQGLTGTALDECIQDVMTSEDETLADNSGDADGDTNDADVDAGQCSAGIASGKWKADGFEWAILGDSVVTPEQCLYRAHSIPYGWSRAPMDASTLSALVLLDMTCVALDDDAGYTPAGAKCSETLVSSDDDGCFTVSACPGALLMRRIDPDVSDPTISGPNTEWHRDTGTAIPESATDLLQEDDFTDLVSALHGTIEASQMPQYSVPVSCELGGAYRKLEVDSALLASHDQHVTLSMCLKLASPLQLVTDYQFSDNDWYDKLSFYLDAEYDNGDDDEETNLHLYGLRRSFDTSSTEWQCRQLSVPVTHPSIVPDSEQDIYSLVMWPRLQFSPGPDDCDALMAGGKFTITPVLTDSAQYIRDPHVNDWQSNSMSDYRIYPEGAPRAMDTEGDCLVVTPVAGERTVIQQTVYFSNIDGPGLGDAVLELTACSSASPSDPEATLAHALYADIRYADGEWDYGWYTPFGDQQCVTLVLPGSVNGTTVTTVEAHIVVADAASGTDVTLCSMSLLPKWGLDNPCKPGASYGDPHLQTLTGHTFDWHAAGRQLLALLPTPNGAVRAEIHNRPMSSSTDAAVVRAAGVAWAALGGRMDAPHYIGPYKGRMLLNVDDESIAVTYNGMEVAVPITGGVTHDLGGARLTLSVPTESGSSDSDPVLLSAAFTYSGVTVNYEVRKSSSDKHYINTYVQASATALLARGGCGGLVGGCDTLAADQAIIDAAFADIAADRPNPFAVYDDSIIPELPVGPLFTGSETTFTDQEASSFCNGMGFTDVLLANCILDMTAAGIAPAGVVTAITGSSDKLTPSEPYQVEGPGDAPSVLPVILGGVGAVCVLGLGAWLLAGPKGQEWRRRRQQAAQTGKRNTRTVSKKSSSSKNKKKTSSKKSSSKKSSSKKSSSKKSSKKSSSKKSSKAHRARTR